MRPPPSMSKTQAWRIARPVFVSMHDTLHFQDGVLGLIVSLPTDVTRSTRWPLLGFLVDRVYLRQKESYALPIVLVNRLCRDQSLSPWRSAPVM